MAVGIGMAYSYFVTPHDVQWDTFENGPSGRISFEARPDTKSDLMARSDYATVNYYIKRGEPAIGGIFPPSRTGWTWNLRAGDIEARSFTHVGGILEVDAMLDPAVTTADGFTTCLWSGGTENKLLGCYAPNQTWVDALVDRIKTLNFSGGRTRRGGD